MQIKLPQIKSFHLPLAAAKTGVLILCLCYCTFFPKDSSSPFFVPARLIHSLIGSYNLNIFWAVLVLTHTLESFYTFSLCRKHSTGFIIGVCSPAFCSCTSILSDVFCAQAGYVITTLLFGFPIWVDMQKRIQAARIQSVMKVE